MSRRATIPNIVVRRLYPSDQEEILSHFRRLDGPSRRARFCGAIKDEGVIRYVANIFSDSSILCGAFIDGHLRGVVELRGVSHFWASTAEAAFTVEAGWQNAGMGDALFDHIIAIARNRRVARIQMSCLKENLPMQHLAMKHNATLEYDCDIVEAVLRPNRPSPSSVAKEIIGEFERFGQIARRYAATHSSAAN
ncbi:Acetyltransferase-like protein [Sulfitobacter noctilucicola]|uniref:GNAT superfamily N-acetyltransferase n=1 Tax=Sulfitobacter noctilucicola TaxID=1342301 RepID=A0A7W6M6S6_9RHOB|nr:GNAT family N-acetyltransferase [Sulfitobacter noctilucicola]KIN62000.1 Acetyltransferase-like protein [Sulfitobacter noctilucicola]MBB4173479.1 GNAT superfamily N-acetyltransferase [Sulfitobacter noctilucicola]